MYFEGYSSLLPIICVLAFSVYVVTTGAAFLFTHALVRFEIIFEAAGAYVENGLFNVMFVNKFPKQDHIRPKRVV
jgi:hypothetical protein